ncbi:hypothetical protein KUV89_11960 [Marinobacter hydrocarbonoclasticus]|nr:hypothetical protein [Marinobacter nauticus]
MRATLLLLTLISGGSYAAGFGCTNETDQRARLACYDQLAEAIAQCSSQEDQLDRLLCYDEFSQIATKATLPAAAPATAEAAISRAPIAPAAAPAVSAEAEFGKTTVPAEEIDAIHGVVASIKTDAYGKWTITLDNGQRWRQTESSRYKLKAGDTITIERAFMGSFLLSREGRGGQTRVKRLD